MASVLATKDNSESASHDNDENNDEEEEDQRDEDQNSKNDFQNSKEPQLISSCSNKVFLPKIIFLCLPSLLLLTFASPFSANEHSSQTTAASTKTPNVDKPGRSINIKCGRHFAD